MCTTIPEAVDDGHIAYVSKGDYGYTCNDNDIGTWRAATNQSRDESNIPAASTTKNCSLSMDDMNEMEDRFRSIVKEEVEKSEKRLEEKISGMMSQMHSDLVEQFITNDLSTEKNIEKLFQFMVEFKHQTDAV